VDLCDFSTLIYLLRTMHFRFSLVVFILLEIFPQFGQAEDGGLLLKLDRTFKMLPTNTEKTAAFISAKQIETKNDEQLEARGDVELRQSGQVITADRLRYDQQSKDVLAEGKVMIEQNGASVSGPILTMNLDSNIGDMEQPEFLFSENHARGKANTLHIAGKQNYSFESATYTTCPVGDDDWLLNMSRLDLDRSTQVGVAHNTVVKFKGVPLLYTPWMDFGLNSARRSGFMGPTFGSTNSGGAEITLPYYWNIAANMDATFSPRTISKRGTQFNNEFRYLEPNYGGELHVDVLSGDRVSGLDRNRLALKHNQNLGAGFTTSLNLNHVSDDAYFRDLSDTLNGTSQTNLMREGVVNYSGGWWNASGRVQRYQTLQDPLSPIEVPYRRQPQINLSAQQTLAGSNFAFASEYVDFRHPTSVNGQRLVIYPSLSYPLLNDPGYFLTPKFGIHSTDYVMDANNPTIVPNRTRTLPIFSLDSGMTFERNDSLLGNGYLQTLEPRVYYVRIPYRDQSQLPNFDTAEAPFSFSQMFTENRFLGSDRVGDADMITLALTSRAIDNADGTERLRVGVAERFSFKAPQVYLLTPADSNSRSDIMITLGGKITRAWKLDSLAEYNPNLGQIQAYSASARYNPESGKLLNLGYRFTRDTLRQMDISTQLPIFGRWQAVARWNYSLQDKRVLEALGGLEYNDACWALRLVAQSFATTTQVRTTGIFIQLELNELVRIGSDPLTALRSSVSGYTKLNDLPAVQSPQGLR
jgi:LPS-assembly protein